MKRIRITPRSDYKSLIENAGFGFHHDYWNEDAYYEFSAGEISEIEEATRACYEMFCEAAQHVIDNALFSRLHIPEFMVPALIRSWEEDDLSLYGRFDFVLVDGTPKLLEFNADTPTSLFEASVIQWDWKEQCLPHLDQFNSIHEALIASWKDIHAAYRYDRYDFGCITDNLEDYTTTSYICATAQEAGLATSLMDMQEISHCNESFYTPSYEPVNCLFKLYPWEWLVHEEFGPEIPKAEMYWIEPAWKMLMSNKEMLVILSELFPQSPYILEATGEKPRWDHCAKPIFSREGANVTLVRNSRIIEQTQGEYGSEGYIYQRLVDIPCFDGYYPVIGSWVIGGFPHGIGIRETKSRITDNLSRFVPHVFIP